MGRPERPLDPTAGPVQAFAADLRKLRQEAGSPKYLQMQRRTGRSRTALAEAAGGDHLATWETVEAYVRACGGDPAEWAVRWEEVRDAIRPQRAETANQHSLHLARRSPRRLARPHNVLAIAGAIAAIAITVIYLMVSSRPPVRTSYLAGSAHSKTHSTHRSPDGTAGPRTIVVQNMIATGPSALIEDSTPAYLSTKPIPFCAEQRCEVPRTQMWSGVPLEATCTVHGAEMTNENTHSPGITHNKNGIFSALWYRCILPDGKSGYISEVYVAPAYRGGLRLPVCLA